MTALNRHCRVIMRTHKVEDTSETIDLTEIWGIHSLWMVCINWIKLSTEKTLKDLSSCSLIRLIHFHVTQLGL